jgi:hypothetical protein
MSKYDIERIIIEGRLVEALDAMLAFSNQNKHLKSFRNNLLVLGPKLRELENLYIQSRISDSEYFHQKSRRVNELINLLEQMPSESLLLKEYQQLKEEKKIQLQPPVVQEIPRQMPIYPKKQKFKKFINVKFILIIAVFLLIFALIIITLAKSPQTTIKGIVVNEIISDPRKAGMSNFKIGIICKPSGKSLSTVTNLNGDFNETVDRSTSSVVFKIDNAVYFQTNNVDGPFNPDTKYKIIIRKR